MYSLFPISASMGLLGLADPTRDPLLGPPRPALSDEVARQVGLLTADLDFVGGEELPRPPADLSSYADAFAAAVASCEHENTNNISYGRQWLCDDCGKYLDRAAMQRARGNSYWYSW